MGRYRIEAAVAIGFLALLAAPAAPSAPPTVSLAVSLVFQHTPPADPSYATVASGVLDLRFSADTSAPAEAVFVLGHDGCFLSASWGVSPSQPSRAAEICLAASGVSEGDFNLWTSGNGPVDPSLVIPLVSSGSNVWGNSAAVAAQVLLRGCGNGAFRRLADLHVPPGALSFQAFVGQLGHAELALSATGATLDTATAAVWSDVLTACDGASVGLPATPVPGVSQTFSGTTERPPADQSLPDVQIDAAARAIDDLVRAQAVSESRGRSLARPLGKSIGQLRQGKLTLADRQLVSFEKKTTLFESRGLLSAAAADGLRAQAAGARAAIAMLGIPVQSPPNPDLFCEAGPGVCPPMDCAYTTYHLRPPSGGIVPLPDGSEARPFRSIGAALARAAADGLCGVDLLLARGFYPDEGDIVLSRHTRIHGDPERRTTVEGSIASTGPYRLVLEDVVLAPDGGRGVDVQHACASTSLTNVEIHFAQGYGVLQRGGSFLADDVFVSQTTSEPDTLTRGTGMALACGVTANLNEVSLEFNATSGLQVVGEGTSALAFDLDVISNGVHPELAAEPCLFTLGAVGVRDQAELTADVFRIHDNDSVGLLVSTSAQATLRHGTISASRELDVPACAGGNNALVTDAGMLDMRNFDIRDADLCGLMLARGGEADLHGSFASPSTIRRNRVGACVQTVGFDLARLQDGVSYVDNDTMLDSSELPVPQPVPSV
jgi:hypothetical protein